MSPAPFLLPDALVLGAGGVAGEAWITGVLAGLEESAGLDFRDCEYLAGTSAGSIVAANLAAGRSPRRPGTSRREGEQAPADERAEPGAVQALARATVRWTLALGNPVAMRAVPLVGPAQALSRAALLAVLPRGQVSLDGMRREIDSLGARFDGRLRVAAVARRNGRRVVFGAPGAPRATVAEAVAASCAIPGYFRPIEIGGREYVDGGTWSPSNLDIAPVGADARVLCLNPTAALSGGTTPLGALGAAVRATAAIEATALRTRGAKVRILSPDRGAAQAIGGRFMDPSRSDRALAAGYEQGLAAGRG